MTISNTLDLPKKPLASSPLFPLQMLAVAWIVEILDFVIFRGRLDFLGVHAREWSGLLGIPLMPFLHGGFAHLISNSLPFLILAYFVQRASPRHFARTSIILILTGGLGTWLLASRGEVHIGASCLIYGYFSYILTRAWLERKALWIILALITLVLYSGFLYGLIPHRGFPISWEGHLSGFLAGIFLGRNDKGKI